MAQSDGSQFLGSGMAQKAATDIRMAKMYRKLLADGEDLPPFEEWVAQQQAQAEEDLDEGFKRVRR